MHVLKWGARLLLMVLVMPARAQEVPRPRARPEPSVAEVLRMAQRAALQSSPERTRSLVRRARLSGLVPTLKLGAERGLQQDLSASSGGDTERTNSSLGDDLSIDAALTFELPRLVFAPEEVRLLSVDRWLAQDRKKLFEEIVRLYFQRRRLLAEKARAAAPDPELELALAESEALLDAFTDGAFGAAIRARAAAE
ncbi:MAG: hypothetical protein QM778_33920 [Myxococcales bacterium]